MKLDGGRLAHNLIEIEVSCLPRHLPEFIEVDVVDMHVGQSLHLSDLELPEGVSIVALGLGADHDMPVISVTARRGGPSEDEEAEGETPEADAEAEVDEPDSE